MSIHDELERIAARAPEVVVPADTWGRAQRARRRQRYGVAAAVAVLVALAGTLAWLPGRDEVDAVDTRGEVGVPDRLWGVPERFTRENGDGEWSSDEVTDDPTVVGTGAAAWIEDWGLPVVVDALDGGYHLLNLSDFNGERVGFSTEAPLALSPDGRRLAYGYAILGPESETEPVPSGVRVVDLTTGDVREIPVLGQEGTIITDVAWSPDGRWLALLGDQQSWWTEDGYGSSKLLDDAGPVVGRVAPEASTADVLEVRNNLGRVEIDDDGAVTFGVRPQRRWDGDQVVEVRRRSDDRATTLGTLMDGSRLVIPSTAMGARWIRIVTPDERSRRAVRIDPSIEYTLSVAVDLMDPRDPTVTRPAPEWPTDWSAVATKVAWIAIPGAFLLMFLLPWLRSRISAGRPTTGPAAR